MSGVYKLRVPIKYLVKDTKKEDIEILEAMKVALNKAIDEGGVIVLPAVRDDSGNPLFDVEYCGP